MNLTKRSGLLAALMASTVSTACLDLDVVSNQSAPTAEQVLSDEAELQLVVAGTWSTLWAYLENNTSSYYAMNAWGNEWQSGNSTLIHSAQEEPRGQYPNDYSLSNRFVAQNPWYAIYEGIDDATQALDKIENEGVRIVVADASEVDAEPEDITDKTDRARAFAYYTQGALYGILALTYDQASISLHTTDRSDPDWWEYVPYDSVGDVAIAQLKKAIEVAQAAAPFVTPPEWMGGNSVDNAGLVRMANYHIARIMAYMPRTPAQRKDVSQGGIVNWNEVIARANAAITSNFVVTLSSSGLTSGYNRYFTSTGTTIGDPRLYGPADMSGAYAEWVQKPVEERNRFTVVTHDRRITGKTSSGAPAPTTNGKYFRYAATCCSSLWDSYLFSHYYWARNLGRWNTGTKVHMSVDEMNLLKAEAHYRLGNLAAAATEVNKTRVPNGELPPVTAAGVPGDINNCVPRTYDGKACGTLLDAIHYERMIELAGLNNYRSWWDRRGFGTLSVGTPTQLPIPVRELQALGLPFYTFGGDEPSSADGVFQVR